MPGTEQGAEKTVEDPQLPPLVALQAQCKQEVRAESVLNGSVLKGVPSDRANPQR